MPIIKNLKDHAVRVVISLCILLFFLLSATGAFEIGFIKGLENFSYDVRLNWLMPNKIDQRIVIVDIDEKSLTEQGRWPWNRNKMADLVNQLFDRYHINVLGFDVVFAEKDESSGLKNLENIQQKYFAQDANVKNFIANLESKLDYDQNFANALKNRKVVLGYYFRQDGNAQDSNIGVLPAASFVDGNFNGKPIAFMQAQGFGGNLALLQQNAASAGHFNPQPDIDGISRKVPMLIQYGGNYYEALSVAVAQLALNSAKLEAGFADGIGVGDQYAGLEWLKLGTKYIPVDKDVSALIPYRGRQGSFRYVSATDVLTGKLPTNALANKIVLIGTTAPGLMDLRATPVQNIYAGVEIHANLIAGILNQNIKERPAYTMGAEVLLLILLGVLLALYIPVLSPLMATLVSIGSLVVMTLGNLAIWQYGNLVLPVSSVLLMIISIYFVNMSYGFFVETRGKRQLAGLFGQYVPPELVEEMANDPESFNLEGESRDLTVLFSDVRGFTSIAEGLDPKQLTQLMNELLSPMTAVIHQYRGTIDKYMGDAVMAFWGAPLNDAEHPKHALQAAMQMLRELKPMNARFAAKGWPTVDIGIGVNTGNMTVGNMGSSFRMAYTVMGDAVNLGSRLEALTKVYGVHIIVSETVKSRVPEYLYRELDIVRVKGKAQSVAIFEPICEAGLEDKNIKDELKFYREAIKLYRAKNWDLAELQFLNMQKAYPNTRLYLMYAERITYFRHYPPSEDWDGAFTYETK